MAIKDEEEYYEADRIGRQGTRIERAKRHYFYEVYKLYIEKRESDEYLAFCDFDDIGTIIRNLLDNCTDNQFIENVLKLNHIVIDEFQDFSSDMLMTMNKLLKEKGTLMLLGDIKQGVFGKRISFKSLGIELNKYKNFELEFNYRNTKEISDLAEIIVNSEYFDKTNELYSKTIKGARKGRVPKIYKYKDENAELAAIVRYIKDYLNKHYESVSVGIIVPTSKFNNTKTYLESRQIKVNNFNEISNDKQKNKVYFGTYKQVKGLEFDVVLMPFMNRENFLSQARSYNEELDIDDDIGLEDIDADILEIELAQLYVGVTRARNELFITTTGELTPLLPSETFKQYIFEGSN
ncbi:3'-5' exonuclease [Staphylococcus warneri]